jgi:CheY-like chemotaxis protein
MVHDSNVEILLVDDDEGHAELVRRNLRRIGLTNPVTSITRGADALDFVFCRGEWAHRSGHSRLLVLLDIKMPGSVDGIEVLRQIKADGERRKIPIIMLTTTDDPREIDRCYELGCSVYLTKPVEPLQFVESVRRLGLFIAVVSLPHEQGTA